MNSTGFFDTHVFAECGTEVRSFRVPVNPELSVRGFAQDALARFVKQTRFAAAVEVAVQDVRVSGVSLFYNDPVCAVVGPNERLEVHILGVKAGDIAPRRLAVGSGVASAAVSPDFVVVASSASTGAAGSNKTAVLTVTAPPSAEHDASAPKGKRARDTPATEVAQAEPKQPAAPSETKAPAVATSSVGNGKTRSSGGAKAANGTKMVNADMPEEASNDVLAESRKNELGWGAEAHKSFAANYVSDPEAMIRAMRKKKREEAKAAKEAAATANDGDVTFVKETSTSSSSRATVVAAAAAAGHRKSDKTTTSKAATAAAAGGSSSHAALPNKVASKAPPHNNSNNNNNNTANHICKPAPAALPLGAAGGGLGMGVGAEYRPVGVARMLDFAGDEE